MNREYRTVVEWCPHCDTEIEMRWNSEEQGLKAFCPVCGKQLMICSECEGSSGGCCGWNEETQSCTPALRERNEPPIVLTEGCKKFLGLYPYNTYLNIVYGDSIYRQSLVTQFGEEAVDNELRRLANE